MPGKIQGVRMLKEAIWLALRAGAVVVMIFLIAALPVRERLGIDGLSALLCAALVCYAGMLVSLVPVAAVQCYPKFPFVAGWMSGVVLRMLVTIVMAVVVYRYFEPIKRQYAFWLGVFYLSLLTWESLLIYRWCQKEEDAF